MSRGANIIGIVSTIMAVLVAVLAVVLPPVKPDQLNTLPIVIVVLLVVAAVMFLLIVPRAARSDRPGTAGFVCSMLGLLLAIPAFWSGLSIVLGTGGAMLGQAGRERTGTAGQRGGLALWAILVGILDLVMVVVIFLVDRLSQ